MFVDNIDIILLFDHFISLFVPAQEFWNQWYFPANTTLFVVGDIDRPVDEIVELIENSLGRVPAGREAPQLPAGAASGNDGAAEALAPLKEKHLVRPPVVHKHG